MNRIYLDHAATTPVHEQVVQAMLPYMEQHFGNPSSIHAFGREAKAALNRARKSIAERLGISPQELIFTSGGTEADNLAVLGTALARQDRGKHIITSQVEHHAVLNACERLEALGFEVTYLPVDQYGAVRSADVREAVRPDTILVSLMYGNNEVGTLQPVQDIGEFLREKDIVLHTDAVQALGTVPLDFGRLPVDLASISSHKINGPKGVGALYVSADVPLEPLFYGGAQERTKRPGTENIPGIVGFAEAVRLVHEHLEDRRSVYLTYRQNMLAILKEEGIVYRLNGHPEQCLPHIINLSFEGVQADTLLMNLDLEGVAASSGSACTAGALQPSHVILAMHADEKRAGSAIRFSFGLGNTREQVEEAARKAARIIRRVRR